MFTRMQTNRCSNRTRRFGSLESLENRTLMAADALPFSEAAAESNLITDLQMEVQSSDTDSEMAVDEAAGQDSQIDGDRELAFDEIAIIARFEYLRYILPAEVFAGVEHWPWVTSYFDMKNGASATGWGGPSRFLALAS